MYCMLRIHLYLFQLWCKFLALLLFQSQGQLSGSSSQNSGMFGPRPQGSQSQPLSQLGPSAENRGNDPSPQGRPSSVGRFSPFHTSGSPLKGPQLPTGFDPNRGPGHHHGNIPLTSALSQGTDLDNSIPKSLDSTGVMNDRDITEIAQDLLKQFSGENAQTQLGDKLTSGDMKSSQIEHRTGESSSTSGVGIHSKSSQDIGGPSVEKMLKLDSESIKCDTNSPKYGTLPKLNIHMSGEQILQACKGLGKSVMFVKPQAVN